MVLGTAGERYVHRSEVEAKGWSGAYTLTTGTRLTASGTYNIIRVTEEDMLLAAINGVDL